MKWRIQLEGDNDDLADLTKIFTLSDLSIKEIDGKFYLYSNSFNTLDDSGLVEEKGKEFLSIINAGLKLDSNYLKLIEFSGVDMLNQEDLKEKHFIHLKTAVGIRAKVRTQITKADGTVIEDNLFEPLLQWYQLAKRDPLVARAFHLISHDFNTWFSLYKLLEILQESGFEPVGRHGKWRKEADRFSQTAQSYAALGLDARHIKSLFTPPTSPMTLDVAQSFIRMLLIEWLKTK